MQRLRQRPRCLLYNREPEGYYGTEAYYVRHAWVVVVARCHRMTGHRPYAPASVLCRGLVDF